MYEHTIKSSGSESPIWLCEVTEIPIFYRISVGLKCKHYKSPSIGTVGTVANAGTTLAQHWLLYLVKAFVLTDGRH